MNSKYNIKRFFTFVITLHLFSITSVVAEEFSAVLSWSKRVELSTPVSGIVQKVFFRSGNIVAKGDVLVQLDPRAFKADLEYAKAKLKNTNEQSIEAKRELERQLDMYDRSMLSEHDLQVAKNNYTAAQSSYLQAKASLTKAKLNLEYSAIRSPFNAVVIHMPAVKGRIVASQMNPPVLVVVAEAKRMLARFYVPSAKASEFILNQGVKVKLDNETLQGKVLNIAFEQEPSQMGYAVDVIFDSKDKVLRAGQNVKVEL